MAKTELTFWDYVRAAFRWRVALPFLGTMPLNKLLLAGFVILGFGNPGFWLLGLAAETALLMFLATHPRFQNLIRGQHLAEAREAWRACEQDLLGRLDTASRNRYVRLMERCRKILETEEAMSAGHQGTDWKSEGLNQLVVIFLRLLHLRIRINETLGNTRREDLEADITSLEQRLAQEAEDSPVHRTLKGTLDIQKARLANLDASTANIRFTEAELDRIEKQVSLVAEEMAMASDPERWSLTLDQVVESMQGTSKWMTDNSALFQAIEEPITAVDVVRLPRRDIAAKQ